MVLRKKRNKEFPIKKCPKCGGKSFTVRQCIHGYGEYYVDLETGEIESIELHSNLNYTITMKYAVCTDCGRRLFKIDDFLNVPD
jgi:DNA-directed RNA polymerase subunit RPC12/RpoP